MRDVKLEQLLPLNPERFLAGLSALLFSISYSLHVVFMFFYMIFISNLRNYLGL